MCSVQQAVGIASDVICLWYRLSGAFVYGLFQHLVGCSLLVAYDDGGDAILLLLQHSQWSVHHFHPLFGTSVVTFLFFKNHFCPSFSD